jgi:hypothetical protein
VPRDAGGAWSTEAPQPLSLGTYSVRVSQRDSADNVGQSVTTFSVVDGDAPPVTIDTPADGATTSDTTPQISGGAGTAAGDDPSVTVRIRDAGGDAIQELSAPVSGGRWSVTAAPLGEGTYTVRAEQGDSVGNLGVSPESAFTVDTADPPPPDRQAPTFVLAPAEERMSEALAGRLAVVAACASACEVSARVTVSPRAARNLGLGRGSTALGSGTRKLGAAGTGTVGVRFSRRARSALRSRDTATATLRVSVTEGAETLAMSRTISLRRSAGLRRIVARGMRLWALCSESCPLSGKLSVAPREARRMGLRARGSSRIEVASGRVRAPAGAPARLTLRVERAAKKALLRARRVRTLLEAVAGEAPEPRRTASRSMTLRR